jgi:hypothetical protein
MSQGRRACSTGGKSRTAAPRRPVGEPSEQQACAAARGDAPRCRSPTCHISCSSRARRPRMRACPYPAGPAPSFAARAPDLALGICEARRASCPPLRTAPLAQAATPCGTSGDWRQTRMAPATSESFTGSSPNSLQTRSSGEPSAAPGASIYRLPTGQVQTRQRSRGSRARREGPRVAAPQGSQAALPTRLLVPGCPRSPPPRARR